MLAAGSRHDCTGQRRGGSLLSTAIITLTLGCMGSPAPGPQAVALVDGVEVPWSAFEVYLEEAGGRMALSLSSEASSRLLDQFLDEELLRREAVARGLVPAGASRRESAALLVEATGDWRAPEEAELRRWYEENRSAFERPPRVRLRQILTDRRQLAERAQAELEVGAEFTAVARRWSIDPSRERGGDQGLLALSDLPAALARTIGELEPGQVSPIVETEYGFHIFQVVERRPAGLLPYAQAREEIAEQLEHRQRRQTIERLVADARQRYNVRVARRNLPFSYTGDYE